MLLKKIPEPAEDLPTTRLWPNTLVFWMQKLVSNLWCLLEGGTKRRRNVGEVSCFKKGGETGREIFLSGFFEDGFLGPVSRVICSEAWNQGVLSLWTSRVSPTLTSSKWASSSRTGVSKL